MFSAMATEDDGEQSNDRQDSDAEAPAATDSTVDSGETATTTEDGSADSADAGDGAEDDSSSDAPSAESTPEKPVNGKPVEPKKKVLPPSAKRKQPKTEKSSDASGRYTAPIPAAKKGPSPQWVPIVMFALWGVGLALIILNYMGLLPGSDDGSNGWYLVAGLGSILAGIVTATQYR